MSGAQPAAATAGGALSDAACPACGSAGLELFYSQPKVPSHSCLLMPTRDAALEFPSGRIDLGLCAACGFIANVSVDPALQAYSASYEETQGFSPRFREFAEDLARRWVERFDLRGRHVVEIGCGKGEFLTTICRLGGNRGTGIDPAIVAERTDSSQPIDWLCEYYSDERHGDLLATADAVICRHTLEHIPGVEDFMRTLRRGVRGGTTILFELPDAVRVLREQAFWDVYYEHCSYFSPGSLARLFRRTGFEVLAVELDYDDQYILLEARPADDPPGAPLELEEDVDEMRREVAHFEEQLAATLAEWNGLLADLRGRGDRAALWGSGSKAVAFLSTLDAGDEVGAVVDINPYRHGKYLAGVGHRISAPASLRDYRPDVVIAMNPIYLDEIRRDLDELGLAPRLVAV
jgi:SAM-dependent methyltransferase